MRHPLQLWLVLYDLLVVSQKGSQAQGTTEQVESQTDGDTGMQVDGGSVVEDSKVVYVKRGTLLARASGTSCDTK